VAVVKGRMWEGLGTRGREVEYSDVKDGEGEVKTGSDEDDIVVVGLI